MDGWDMKCVIVGEEASEDRNKAWSEGLYFPGEDA